MSNQPAMDITYVAQLSRLNLSREEIERFQAQLSQVLTYVQQLSQLDVSAIEPTAHASPQTNVFRSDEIQPSLKIEASLQNAPRKNNDLFIVPKVVE